MTPGLPDRQSQLLRGVLDMCLLALLIDEPAYGYEVTRRLAANGLDAADGSVYPLLARLQRLGLVSTSMQPGESGPPRKYYRTSAAGRRTLVRWSADWHATARAVEQLLAPVTKESS